MCREKAENPKLVFTFLSTTLPQLSLQLTIIVLDISCFYIVQKQRKNPPDSKVQRRIHKKHTNILAEIPFRASLISTFTFFLQVVGHIVIASRLQPLEKYAFVTLLVKGGTTYLPLFIRASVVSSATIFAFLHILYFPFVFP